jgi:predicted DNA binding CopG/RHH family protein
MKYDTLLQVRVSPDTAAAIRTNAAARGLKVSEYLRSAIALSIAMDTTLESTK